jgi:hypothetical protein
MTRMNVQEVSRHIPTLMRVEFDGAPWSWLVDPDGGGSMPWIAEVGPMAEAFAPADSFPDVSIRVIVHCNDPSGDGAFPQLHIKCGILKEIVNHPDLLAAVNQLNLKTIFGRLQLHAGVDGSCAVTCEHFVTMHRFASNDVASVQSVLDTLSMVRDRCAGKAAHELQPVFGGRPFAEEGDGALLVMAG